MRKWDAETEDLLGLSDKDQEERLRIAVLQFEFDQFLGAFPWDDRKGMETWQSLTSHVSSEILSRLSPPNKKISSAAKPLSPTELEMLAPALKALSKEYANSSFSFSSGA